MEGNLLVNFSYQMPNLSLKLEQLGSVFDAFLILMLSAGYGGSKPQKTTKGFGAASPSEGVKTLTHIQCHLIFTPLVVSHMFLMSAVIKHCVSQGMVVLLVYLMDSCLKQLM